MPEVPTAHKAKDVAQSLATLPYQGQWFTPHKFNCQQEFARRAQTVRQVSDHSHRTQCIATDVASYEVKGGFSGTDIAGVLF